MRKLTIVALAVAGLTTTSPVSVVAGATNGLNLANGMDINGAQPTGGVHQDGLNLTGVILPKLTK